MQSGIAGPIKCWSAFSGIGCPDFPPDEESYSNSLLFAGHAMAGYTMNHRNYVSAACGFMNNRKFVLIFSGMAVEVRPSCWVRSKVLCLSRIASGGLSNLVPKFQQQPTEQASFVQAKRFAEYVI